MRFFTKVPPPEVTPETEDSVKQPTVTGEEQVKQKDAGSDNGQNSGSELDPDAISVEAQPGIQDIEATTSVWSRQHLILAYVFIWIIYFVDAMQQSMGFSLLPYVTSEFYQHSLTATTGIMSSLIGGLFKLPLAKILDIWGRPQGAALSMCFLTLGLVMMAGCDGVTTYAAAQVFYWLGYNGLDYSLSIFVADTSALKNRALMFAFISSPYIATVWIGGPLAEAFLNGPGFRWGYGTFAIVTPVVVLPMLFLFMWNLRKAKAAGLIPKRESNRTLIQSFKHYAIEFDLVGILLLAGGLALFLLPFSIYSYQEEGFRSATIICMIVFGVLLLIGFAAYEKLVAPVTFIPFQLLTDRTVLGACVLSSVLFVSFFIWDAYFPSMLQVVYGLSIVESSYINNIYSIGSCFWALVVGGLVRVTGRFKWLALYFGVPLTILGNGLMIAFRQPGVNIGYVIMCQIFIAFSGGTLVICEQMAAMAAVGHQHVAVVLALEAMFASVGGALGSTIASAIWTSVFPQRLAEYLPEEAQANLTDIYASIEVQLSYEIGTPTRDAISAAYGDAQKYMLIASTTVLTLAVISVVVWRDIKVKDFKQVKGNVI